MPKEIRAAIYARVSSDLQEKEQTIRSQLEELRKYILEREYFIAGEYIDDGYSGATLDRPGLDRLRDAEYRIWVNNYMPWCIAMEKVRMISSPRVNIIAVVISVVVDNWSLRQCERHYGLKCHGEAMRSLHAGLTAYAKVAGY